jgi:hypothetical protein
MTRSEFSERGGPAGSPSGARKTYAFRRLSRLQLATKRQPKLIWFLARKSDTPPRSPSRSRRTHHLTVADRQPAGHINTHHLAPATPRAAQLSQPHRPQTKTHPPRHATDHLRSALSPTPIPHGHGDDGGHHADGAAQGGGGRLPDPPRSCRTGQAGAHARRPRRSRRRGGRTTRRRR